MPFYLRKSLRAGPLRFNLSKSGIGVSTGIPGFRIGTGPRGNYVHLGRNGIYYRTTLPRGSTAKRNFSPDTISNSAVLEEIESGDVQNFQDSESEDLLAEINTKYGKINYWQLLLALSIILLILLYLAKTAFCVYLIFVPTALMITFLAGLYDKTRKTVVLFYDLEGEAGAAYQTLHDAFEKLRQCARAWHIPSQGVLPALMNER